MPKFSSSRRGFTIIELLVVIAIMALLATLLIPTFERAREVGRVALCLSNMRQMGGMTAQYGADTKGYLMMPSTPHYLKNIGSGATGAPGGPISFAATTSATFNCPWGSPKVYPISFAWFWVMGYLPPITPKYGRMAVLDCPDAYVYDYAHSVAVNAPWRLGKTQTWACEFTYSEYSSYIKAAISDSGANPQGGTWEDNGDAQSYIGYVSRGWWQNNVSHLKTQRADEAWKSTSCMAVDWWSGHTDGKNLLFMDGHAKFGDKPIGGIAAESWFTTFTGTGGTGSVGLWNYYETGVP